MNTTMFIKQQPFYLATIDILKGFCILMMIIGHTILYWDHSIVYKWPDITPVVAVFLSIALIAHPGFFFLYGFNVVNSLLRKEDPVERDETRIRLLKRTVIFFLLAELCEGAAAIINSPEYLLNFLLTWELFHMFALSTFILLIVFEFAWKIESQSSWSHRQVSLTVLTTFLVLIIFFFLLIHDYSNLLRIPGYYVNLDIISILQRAIFEYGQNPVIPWLSFPIVGGLLAVFLNLPFEKKEDLVKKSRVASIGGILVLIIGIMLLVKERYVSTPVLRPASSSFVFIAIGSLVLTTTAMILFIDLNTHNSGKRVKRLFLPAVLVSKISLTLYIIHNIAYIIPQQLTRSLFPTESAILVIGIVYSLIFVPIAFYWQKSGFKYSLEWMIMHLQNAQWRWWIKTPTKSLV